MIRDLTRFTAIAILAVGLGTFSASPALAQTGGQGNVITITQVDTSHFPQVTVYVSVTDANGNPVTTVPKSAFTLIENGQPVQITDVSQAGEQGAVSTVLTIDRSGSMNKSGKLDAAKKAANAFIDMMRPEDKTAVVVFNTSVDVLQPLTNDKAALHNAINGIQAIKDTALYDGLQQSVSVLNGVQGRKVIVLLSDGLDNSSKVPADTVIGGIDKAELSVYTIGLGDPGQGITQAGINENTLRSIADKSHGSYTYTPDPSQLQALYQQISTRVQNEYRLTYTSPSVLRDGVRRGLEVRVNASAVQANYNPGGLIPETALALEWPVFGALALALVALLALPDVVRGLGGGVGKLAGGRSLFKKRSRVKLTKPAASTSAPSKPAPGKTVSPDLQGGASRVRIHGGKGG